MHGSVRRRGPAAPGGRPRARPWTFVLELGMGADGRRRQLQRSGFATKREAQEALQAEVQRRSAGVVIDAGRLSMLQFLRDRWLPGLVWSARLHPSLVHPPHPAVPRADARRTPAG